MSECFGALLAGGEGSCNECVGNVVVWTGVEGDEGGESGERAGVEDGVGVDGCGVGGDDDGLGVSGGSGSSEAICCSTWSSSAGNDVAGSWSSGREPPRSLLLADPVVGRPLRPSPGDLTNRSTSEGLAFNVGRRPSITWMSNGSNSPPRVTQLALFAWACVNCSVCKPKMGCSRFVAPQGASPGKMSFCTP